VGFGMLWRACKIHFQRDDRHVADARGRRFPKPTLWRGRVAAVHTLAGAALLATGILTLPLGLPLPVWTGLGGLTLWLFVMTLQGLARRARAGTA